MSDIQITLPPSISDDLSQDNIIETLDHNSLLIIGANGSGKSRFGWRIEELNQKVHRISASDL